MAMFPSLRVPGRRRRVRGRISIVLAFTFFSGYPIRLGKRAIRRCAQRPRRDDAAQMEGRTPRFDYVLQHAARGRGSIARAQNSSRGCCLSSSVLTAHARRVVSRRVVLTTSAPSSHACAAAAFGQRGRTLSTAHREAGAAAARGLCAKHANCRRVQECADTREGRRCFARRIDRAARAGVHNRGLRGSVRLHAFLTSHSKRPFPEDVDWSPQYSKTRRITRSISFSVYRPLDAPRSRAKTDVRTGPCRGEAVLQRTLGPRLVHVLEVQSLVLVRVRGRDALQSTAREQQIATIY